MNLPKPPAHLRKAGKKLWTDIAAEFEIDDAGSRAVLQSACESADMLAAASETLAREGFTVATRDGVKAHPAANIERSARAAMLRALRQLGLDPEPPAKIGRPATRV